MSRNVRKCTSRHRCPAKTQISSTCAFAQSDQSLLPAWRNLAFLAIQNVPSENSNQTARMYRLIWIFAGRTFSCTISDVAAHMYLFQGLCVLVEECPCFYNDEAYIQGSELYIGMKLLWVCSWLNGRMVIFLLLFSFKVNRYINLGSK